VIRSLAMFARPAPRLASRVPALVAALLLLTAGTARAAVVERVVAIVGERAILMSDLRERAQPFLVRVHAEVPAGAQRAAAISQLYKTLIERMVDEELEQRAANRARVAVSTHEIDEALQRIAAQNGIGVEQLVDEAVKSGLSERQYRSEVRRQVLEAKLLNLRLQGRIRVTDEDLRGAYRRIVIDERRKLPFSAAWIRIDAPRSLGKTQATERRQFAEELTDRARSGADFGELARAHSDDLPTRATGGALGQLKPVQLAPEIDRVALTLDVNEVSRPLRVGDSLVVLKVLSRQESELPSYEEARRELSERVYLEKMNKARKHWLESLRRRTHVEVRL
jgi:peptidyl-prolyl cis-trans isomerase SurA